MQIFGEQVTWIELFGIIFNLLGVWLTVKKNVACFPTGIAGVAFYAVFYYQAKLYADTILQVFYIGLLAYGWLQWNNTRAQKEFVVSRINNKLWIQLSIICAIATLAIGTVFIKYTDASLPYLDSLLTSMSLVAQWLVAKKKIENWIIWIIADVIYVGMFLYKHIYPTSFLYFIFILLAVSGYFEWKKKLLLNEPAR
jgi:nicotinamide mononucleotide transporter